MNTTLYRSTLPTPIGTMVALASDRGLCALEFTLPDRMDLLGARLSSFFGAARILDVTGDHEILAQARAWLSAYFAGRFPGPQVPLDQRGTPFERRVWDLLRTIPAGARSTYGELARQLGIPHGARAVGGAARKNPISLLVPCHRVVGTGGALTGYGGGIENKQWLLRHESTCC